MPSAHISFFVKDGVAKNIRIFSEESTAYGVRGFLRA
jgi:hypothetical protein